MATGGAAMTTTVTGTESALIHLRVDYNQFKQFPAGKALHSDVFSVGGQLWRIDLYPQGIRELHQHVSIFLRHFTRSKSTSVRAIFEPFFLDTDGGPSPKITKSASVNEFHESDNNNTNDFDTDDLGYPEFYQTYAVESYVVDGHINFVCAVVVLNELGPAPVPPSGIQSHLAYLLDDDTEETSGVSFLVGGEMFRAHRAVFAARAPVFKAQLFGSMLESTMTSTTITLHEIAPDVFRAMLRFIYTDVWPGVDELGDSPVEMLQDLVAAADRYAFDRLKLMCARNLWDNVSIQTIAAILACAEMYSCLELKKNALTFAQRRRFSGRRCPLRVLNC